MSNPNENVSREEREKLVYNLSVELADVTNRKKSTVGGFNDEIKRLKAEIRDLTSCDMETFNVVA